MTAEQGYELILAIVLGVPWLGTMLRALYGRTRR